MKNIEIVNALNNLISFVDAQKRSNTALLSVKGQFAIKSNERALLDKYKPYEDTLNEIKEKYEGKNETEECFNEMKELMNIEVDVELRKVSEDDFKDGVTIEEIMMLDFMTE